MKKNLLKVLSLPEEPYLHSPTPTPKNKKSNSVTLQSFFLSIYYYGSNE